MAEIINKKGVKIINGLLTHINVVDAFRSNKNICDAQRLTIRQGHEFVIDALKYLKAAKKQGHGNLITDANSEWIDMLKEKGK